MAAETLVNTGLCVLAGEVSTSAHINYIQVARETIERIGYNSSEMGFDADGCAVMVCYDEQSPDIAQGVNEGEGVGFGYGRRRPRPDVRLCLRRNPHADAVLPFITPTA